MIATYFKHKTEDIYLYNNKNENGILETLINSYGDNENKVDATLWVRTTSIMEDRLRDNPNDYKPISRATFIKRLNKCFK